MRWLRDVLITPIGIALLVMHWLVVIFAYNGDLPEPGFEQGTDLLFYLSLVDVLPLLGANALVSPLSHAFSNQTATYLSFGALIAFASLQWLLIGKFLHMLVGEYVAGEDNGLGSKTRER